MCVARPIFLWRIVRRKICYVLILAMMVQHE